MQKGQHFIEGKIRMTREIILDILEALILLGVFSSLTNQKRYFIDSKIRSGLFCIIYVIATCLSTYYVNNNLYNTLFIILISILILTFITKTSLYYSTIIVSLFITITFTTETLVQFIEMFLLKVELNEILNVSKYLFIFLVGSKLLQIFIVVMILKHSTYFKEKLLDKEKSFFSEFLIHLGIFNLFIYILIFSVLHVENNKIYSIVIFSMFFFFSIIALIYLKEREKMINIDNKYKIQKHQISNMEEIISIIRQEKHDYANHINVIQALCCLNKPNTVDRIKEYVSNLSDIIHLSFRYLDTGNDYIDGLLSIKNNYATKNGIDFNVRIDESFSLLKIREDELISIISNIVDNAFEAFRLKSCTENKEISIITFLEDREFCIEIADNGEVIPEEIIKKIFEKGFSTKTKEKAEHGYGLYITKQLVEHNNGSISVESTLEKTKFLVKFLI